MSVTAAGPLDDVPEIILPEGVLDNAVDDKASSAASHPAKTGVGGEFGEVMANNAFQPRHQIINANNVTRRNSSNGVTSVTSAGHDAAWTMFPDNMTTVRFPFIESRKSPTPTASRWEITERNRRGVGWGGRSTIHRGCLVLSLKKKALLSVNGAVARHRVGCRGG